MTAELGPRAPVSSIGGNMASMRHPVRLDQPLRPSALPAGAILVPRGAVGAGGRADALCVLDDGEHRRRQHAGMGALTSLTVLDAMMNLPLDVPVRRSDISPYALARIGRADAALVVVEADWVTRVGRPPLTVLGALVSAPSWRDALRRAVAFGPFSQRIVVLDRAPTNIDLLLWEAELAGVGVWLSDDASTNELLAPEPFRLRYLKAATWRFAERAYRAATASARSSLPSASAGRPSSTGAVASGPRQLQLPLR